MARTIGPLFSLEAEGSIGNALTYSKWKGRNLVKSKVPPANPKTLAQRAARLTIQALNTLWQELTPEEKAEWDELAAAKSYSPFNAFTSDGVRREAQGLAPAATPTGGDAYSGATADFIAATDTAGRIAGALTMLSAFSATDWCYICVEEDAAPGNAPFRNHLYYVKPGVSTEVVFDITDIPAGDYNLTAWGAGTNGEATILASDYVTVT